MDGCGYPDATTGRRGTSQRRAGAWRQPPKRGIVARRCLIAAQTRLGGVRYVDTLWTRTTPKLDGASLSDSGSMPRALS